MCSNDTDTMANRVDPDKTAHLNWPVCPDLSVPILRIIMVTCLVVVVCSDLTSLLTIFQ